MQNKKMPELDIKNINGGYAKLIFDTDLFMYKLITLKNGVQQIQEILSPSKAINIFKELK